MSRRAGVAALLLALAGCIPAPSGDYAPPPEPYRPPPRERPRAEPYRPQPYQRPPVQEPEDDPPPPPVEVPRAEPDDPPPVEVPEPDPEPVAVPRANARGDSGGPLSGRTAQQLTGALGRPALDVTEGLGRRMQFVHASCVLDAYLYRPRGRGEAVVTHVDAGHPDGRDMDAAACTRAIMRR